MNSFQIKTLQNKSHLFIFDLKFFIKNKYKVCKRPFNLKLFQNQIGLAKETERRVERQLREALRALGSILREAKRQGAVRVALADHATRAVSHHIGRVGILDRKGRSVLARTPQEEDLSRHAQKIQLALRPTSGQLGPSPLVVVALVRNGRRCHIVRQAVQSGHLRQQQGLEQRAVRARARHYE